MATRRQNVVRVLLHIAKDLDRRHYPAAGVLRQLAAEVAVLPAVEVEEGRCDCGGLIVQPGRGRPRKHCLACSPQRNKNAKMQSQSVGEDGRQCA